MNRIEVLHVVTTIERGGAENAVLILARAQAQSGYGVAVLPLKGEPELIEDFTSAGIDVNVSLLNRPILKQLIELRKIRKRGLIVHAHLPRSELFARLAWGAGNVIFTRHNSEKFIPSMSSFFSRSLSRWVTKSAKVIAISESVKEFLLNSKEVRHTDQIRVIYYGFQPKNLKSSRNYPVTSSSFSHRSLRLGTISRLVPQKNVTLLIMLAKKLMESELDFTLSIVGKGPEEETLKTLVKRNQLENHVFFLGRMRDVSNFLDNLDLFLLTSNYEGFGLVLLEAIDHNLPIVASNTSSIPEVLSAQHPGLFETGNLYSLQEKLEDLVNDISRRKLCLEIQRKRLNFFSISKYFSSHDELYKEVIEDFT